MLPPRLRALGRSYGAELAALAALTAFALWLVPDYGLTWDEEHQWTYGELALRFYRTLGRDRAALHFFDLPYYGALFETLAALVHEHVAMPLWLLRHHLVALTGVAGVAGTYVLGRQLGGRSGGWAAAALLTLSPGYFGHMFFNSKDIPFAAAYVWALVAILRYGDALPRPPWRRVIACGLTIGTALGIRVVGGFLVGYLLLAVGVYAAWAWRRGAPPRPLGALLAGRTLAALALAYVVMLLAWPYALMQPLTNPLRAVRQMSRFQWKSAVLFRGEMVPADALPPTYIPLHLLYKLPEPMVLLLLTGAVWATVVLWRRRDRLSAAAPMRVALVGLAAGFPPLYLMLHHAVLYDEIRHVLFILPPSCALAALPFIRGAARLAARPRWLQAAAALPLAAWLAYHVSLLVRLHPHEYVYYNAFTGGLAGAYGRFETDYWGNSYREAVERLAARLTADEPGVVAQGVRVSACSNPLSAAEFFPPWMHWVDTPGEADFFIATTRYGCHTSVPGRELLRVERLGVPLAFVFDRRGGAAIKTTP